MTGSVRFALDGPAIHQKQGVCVRWMPGSSPGMDCHSGAMPTGPREARSDDRLRIAPE
ncbi:hypothetical protein GALL_488390 [mine drainage metagenome]|uniref:Uncharacterized protein n=1 Tax=mine drainage metagenome TaxID=410659 RepID=A0A1J5PPP8_9ZZZZ